MAKILTTGGVEIIIRLWVKGPRIVSWRAIHWVDRSTLVMGHTNYANTEEGRQALVDEITKAVDVHIFGPNVEKEITL